MRHLPPAFGLLLIVSLPLAGRADLLAVPVAPPAAASLALPQRGDSQQGVLARYGEPQRRHPQVGGSSPAQPPITRWDYDRFSVFFEHQRVIDAVVPDAPAPLFDTDALRSDRR